MLISDVLQVKGRDVARVRTTDSIWTAVRHLADRRIGALVVEDKWMKLVGIFSERDFVNATATFGTAALDLTVDKLMTASVITCRPSDRVDAALGVMTLAKVRHLPVVEAGELRGIVSIGDLVKHRLDEKELEANVLLEIARMRVVA
jgi:CBS domain-containing protein